MPSSLLPRRAALAFAAGLLALTATHAQTAVQLSGGFLNITAPSTNQSVKVEIRGGETRLFGFPGIADGQAYQGLLGVSLATGAGNDKVEFDIQSPFSFDIRINTGNGDSETLVKWEILPGATTPLANLEVRSGTGAVRKVILELESEATAASFQIDAGSPTELQTKVISSNTSDRLRVAFAGTSPKTQFEVTSAASSLDVDVRGGGTPAADDLIYKIVQTRPADVALNWSLDAGASDDKLDAIVSAPGSTVTQGARSLAAQATTFSASKPRPSARLRVLPSMEVRALMNWPRFSKAASRTLRPCRQSCSAAMATTSSSSPPIPGSLAPASLTTSSPSSTAVPVTTAFRPSASFAPAKPGCNLSGRGVPADVRATPPGFTESSRSSRG